MPIDYEIPRSPAQESAYQQSLTKIANVLGLSQNYSGSIQAENPTFRNRDRAVSWLGGLQTFYPKASPEIVDVLRQRTASVLSDTGWYGRDSNMIRELYNKGRGTGEDTKMHGVFLSNMLDAQELINNADRRIKELRGGDKELFPGELNKRIQEYNDSVYIRGEARKRLGISRLWE